MQCSVLNFPAQFCTTLCYMGLTRRPETKYGQLTLYVSATFSVLSTPYRVQYTDYSVQFTVYSVQCTVYSVQCTLLGVLYDPCPQLADVDHALLCPPSEKAEQQELALKVGFRYKYIY